MFYLVSKFPTCLEGFASEFRPYLRASGLIRRLCVRISVVFPNPRKESTAFSSEFRSYFITTRLSKRFGLWGSDLMSQFPEWLSGFALGFLPYFLIPCLSTQFRVVISDFIAELPAPPRRFRVRISILFPNSIPV